MRKSSSHTSGVPELHLVTGAVAEPEDQQTMDVFASTSTRTAYSFFDESTDDPEVMMSQLHAFLDHWEASGKATAHLQSMDCKNRIVEAEITPAYSSRSELMFNASVETRKLKGKPKKNKGKWVCNVRTDNTIRIPVIVEPELGIKATISFYWMHYDEVLENGEPFKGADCGYECDYYLDFGVGFMLPEKFTRTHARRWMISEMFLPKVDGGTNA